MKKSKHKNKNKEKRKNQNIEKKKSQTTKKPKSQSTEKQKDESTDELGVSWLGPMLLWALCLCMLLFGIAFLVTARNVFYILTGLLGLILAAMLCPYITERTRDLSFLSGYYRFRVIIIILLFVLLFVMIFFGIG